MCSSVRGSAFEGLKAVSTAAKISLGGGSDVICASLSRLNGDGETPRCKTVMLSARAWVYIVFQGIGDDRRDFSCLMTRLLARACMCTVIHTHESFFSRLICISMRDEVYAQLG